MTRPVRLLALPLLLVGALAWADGDQPAAPTAPQPAAPAHADVVVLKDGRRLEGEIVAEDERFVSLKSGGVTRAYARDSITSVEKAPRAPGQADPSTPPASPSQPASPPTEPAKGKKGNKGEKRDAPPLSDAAKKWLDDLLAKSADADETVRRSIVAAVDALGPQAVAAVRAAQAAAPEGPQKQFLDKLAGDLEQRRNRAMGPDGGAPGDGPGGRRRPLEDMMERLELTDEQKPKFQPIIQDSFKKGMEILRDARRDGTAPAQAEEKVAAVRADMLAQAKGVLTEPQYVMFEDMVKQMFNQQRRGPGAMPPKPSEPAKPADPAAPPPPMDPPK